MIHFLARLTVVALLACAPIAAAAQAPPLRAEGVVPGATLTDLSPYMRARPALDYSAAFSPKSVVASRVVSITDVQNGVVATGGVQTNWRGPKAIVDGLGRPALRFEGNEYLAGDPAYANAAGQNQAVAIIMVGRFHRPNSGGTIFSFGSSEEAMARGGVVTGMGGGPTFEIYGVNNRGNYFRGTSNDPTGSRNFARMQGGAQMQVAALVQRTADRGGTSFILDGIVATNPTNAQNGGPSAHPALLGFEIGRNAASVGLPSTTNPVQDGSGLVADIYRILVFKGVFSDAQVLAAVTRLQADWDIQTKTDALVIEGASIAYGLASRNGGGQPPTSGVNPAMLLTEPGSANALGPTWRVTDFALSGNTSADLTKRRDAPFAWPTMKLPGQNIVFGIWGTNDGLTLTYDQTYAAQVAVLNTARTGWLQRGWSVLLAIHIARADARQIWTNGLNTHLADTTQLLIDTDAGPGGTYQGKVGTVNLRGIQVGSLFPFRGQSDVNATTFYQLDGTHLSASGLALMVSGGDTPRNGIHDAVQHYGAR